MSLGLHNAIRSCNFEEIRNALENDASEINVPDPILGWTPLYKAVLYRDYEITKILLENGADPDQFNQIGENALYMAVENNLEDIVNLLIQHKAKVDYCGNDGQTALHLASLKKNGNIVKTLIKSGADVNSMNGVGKTPLHFAIESECLETVKDLLEAGANPNLRDKCGISPIQMSNSLEIKELVALYNKMPEDNALKEKNLNIFPGSEPKEPNIKIKEQFQQNLTKIDQQILSADQKRSELKEVGESIEKAIDQFHHFEPSQNSSLTETSTLSKKKTVSYEEYKEEILQKEVLPNKSVLKEEPSMIKDESSIKEVKGINETIIDDSSVEKDILVKSSIINQKVESNVPLTLKTSVTLPSNSKPILLWLQEIHLEDLLQNFIDLGLQTNTSVIDLLKNNTQNWDKMLITHLGIDKPGHRKRIITQLKEDMGLCKRSGLFKLKNSNAKLNFLGLSEWLKSLNLEEWTQHFIAAGYDDYESLIFQMTTDNAINEKILEEDVMIDDQFARMKICNQLMEDALKASEIHCPDNFEGEISFEINEQKPGNWKETCHIF